jgi:hypothetical protein
VNAQAMSALRRRGPQRNAKLAAVTTLVLATAGASATAFANNAQSTEGGGSESIPGGPPSTLAVRHCRYRSTRADGKRLVKCGNVRFRAKLTLFQGAPGKPGSGRVAQHRLAAHHRGPIYFVVPDSGSTFCLLEASPLRGGK